MQTFIGSPALSTFRQEKLFNQIQLLLPEIVQLSAHFVHFIDAEKTLNNEEITVLEKLLCYGPQRVEVSSEGHLFLVVPRSGTISPWSSKATDIAHNCGLQNVSRIERGIAYHVQGVQWCANNQQIIADCLHDRMIEMVLDELDAASCLFEHHQPFAGESIDILASGKDALIEANQLLGLALSDDEIDYLLDHFRDRKSVV